jgi:hypothetical protein
MKLRRTTILTGIETLLTQDIMAMLADDFARNDVRMAASLLAIDRAAREDAVALLVEEHDRLRALFARAARAIRDEALRERLEHAAQGQTANLRLSELESETGVLRNLLVDLHIHVEMRDDPAARDLDRAIWRVIGEIERTRNPAA